MDSTPGDWRCFRFAHPIILHHLSSGQKAHPTTQQHGHHKKKAAPGDDAGQRSLHRPFMAPQPWPGGWQH